MDKRSWITIGAIALGVGVAIYFGLNVSPSSQPVAISTPNTAAIDSRNQLTQATLQALTTQQQIATQLNLSTPQATPLSSTGTAA